MPSVQRGLLADGLGTLTAGLLGTVGLNTFSGSIGIATATGITSRRVAFAIAGLFLAMSMLPPVWRLLAAVPLEVAGGVLMFSARSEEHTSELQSLMRISYAVFCLKKKKITSNNTNITSK